MSNILLKSLYSLLILLLSFETDAQNSLVAYYPLNNSADDYSGNGNNGTINGGITAVPDRFNNPCSALLFDGTSGYIEVPNSNSLGSPQAAITITAWYKLTNLNTTNYWLTLVCKGTGSDELDDNPQYRLQVQHNRKLETNNCSITPSMYSTISLKSKYALCDMDVDKHLFEPDVWHFYAATYDGSKMKCFMDGKKIFEENFSTTFNLNNSSLYIGKDEPGNNEYFSGCLDELEIYNACLSEAEIVNIYNDNNANPFSEDFDVQPMTDIIRYTGASVCNSKSTFDLPAITTSCTQITVKQIEGLSSGSVFNLGFNRIKYRISTLSDFTQYVSFYVVVKDTVSPTLKVPKDVTLYVDHADSGVVYNYLNPVASDNCKLKSISRISGNASGDFFYKGNNKITYVAIDESGNQTEKIFLVNVLEKRTIVKQPQQTIDTASINKTKVIVTHDTLTVLKKDTVRLTTADTVNIIKRDTIKIYKTDTFYVQKPVIQDYSDTLSVKSYKPNNLLFLVDVSNSMNEPDMHKIRYAKLCIQELVKKLRNFDILTIILFSDSATVFYPTSLLTDRPALVDTIEKIRVNGATNTADAIEKSYEVFKQHYLSDANNEIFVFTDDEINDITKKQKKIISNAASNPTQKIRLNIFAFGNEKKQLDDLRELSNLGSGSFMSINTEDDAREILSQLIKINSKY